MIAQSLCTNHSHAVASKVDILRALDTLTQPGQMVELRAVGVTDCSGGKPHMVSKLFTDMQALANEALALDGHAKGTYITLNPVRAGTSGSASDTDIECRRWLPVDVDPVRPANTASSDEEHDGAQRVACDIQTFLRGLGWPEPVEADSGNGAHLLYRIDLPAYEGGLVAMALKALDFLFTMETQQVDTAVGNPARIWKLYGTVARKGEDTPERPHRPARILNAPTVLSVVTRAQLETLAAMLPNPNDAVKDSGKALDIEVWLAEYRVAVERVNHRANCTVYRLAECPWGETHSDEVDGAAVVQFANGALHFKCHHAHCSDKGWRDFRTFYQPDAFTRRDQIVAALPSSGIESVKPKAMTPELEFSDTGNARRLAQKYGAGLRYVRQWGWLVYREGHWQRDDEGYAMQCAKACVNDLLLEAACSETDSTRRSLLLDHAKKSFNANRLQAMLKLAESEPELVARVGDFDADPWLMNVRNGTLNLRTGALRPHDPKDMLTKLAPVRYEPHATAPRWERFLSEVFAGDTDLIAFVQRALGYSLTGVTREQVFFTCWGAGCNGKSTLLNAVAGVVGDYAKPLRADALMSQPYKNSSGADPEIAALVGARFVTAQEPRGGELDTARVKALTGQDSLQVRELNKMPFTFVPQFKLWLSTNERPNVTETTTGIWRRIKLIPFTVNFERRKDDTLPDALAAEGSGILYWLIAGLAAWNDCGLGDAQAVRDATREYREEEDPYIEFFTEILAPRSVDKRVELSVTYDAFKTWAQSAGAAMLSDRTFARQAEAHGYTRKRSNGRRWLLGCDLVLRSVDSADNIPF